MGAYTALWLLAPWCQSTSPSVVTVLTNISVSNWSSNRDQYHKIKLYFENKISSSSLRVKAQQISRVKYTVLALFCLYVVRHRFILPTLFTHLRLILNRFNHKIIWRMDFIARSLWLNKSLTTTCTINSGVLCRKQVSRAGTSNYIP